MAGFGIDVSVASAEEVQNAIVQQGQKLTINKDQMARVKAMFPEEELKTLGKQLGLKKLSDMPVEVFQKLEKEYEESHKELLQEPINGIWG